MNKPINEELVHKYEIVLILMMKIISYVHHGINMDSDELKQMFEMNITHVQVRDVTI
jgi:hypothetical protein